VLQFDTANLPGILMVRTSKNAGKWPELPAAACRLHSPSRPVAIGMPLGWEQHFLSYKKFLL
jgi:hypothetical protein